MATVRSCNKHGQVLQLSTKEEQVEPDVIYERAAFMNAFRLFGFVLLTTLNISLAGGLITRLLAHNKINWAMESNSGLFLLFADILLLVPILLEVRKVRVWRDHVILNTLIWTSRLTANDLVMLKNIENVTFYMLKTRRMVYLIGKRDFRRVEDLVAHLQALIDQKSLTENKS